MCWSTDGLNNVLTDSTESNTRDNTASTQPAKTRDQANGKWTQTKLYIIWGSVVPNQTYCIFIISLCLIWTTPNLAGSEYYKINQFLTFLSNMLVLFTSVLPWVSHRLFDVTEGMQTAVQRPHPPTQGSDPKTMTHFSFKTLKPWSIQFWTCGYNPTVISFASLQSFSLIKRLQLKSLTWWNNPIMLTVTTKDPSKMY